MEGGLQRLHRELGVTPPRVSLLGPRDCPEGTQRAAPGSASAAPGPSGPPALRRASGGGTACGAGALLGSPSECAPHLVCPACCVPHSSPQAVQARLHFNEAAAQRLSLEAVLRCGYPPPCGCDVCALEALQATACLKTGAPQSRSAGTEAAQPTEGRCMFPT